MKNARSMPNPNPHATGADPELERFYRSLMQQTLLKEFGRLIRPLNPKRGLEVGSQGGAFSLYLRKAGGAWQTLLTSDAAVETTRRLVPEGVAELTSDRLPFDDHSFDVVVLADVLMTLSNPAPLIDECHRVLRDSGHLALNVPYAGRVKPLRPVRRLLQRRRPALSIPQRDLDKSDLFELLKTGFDVIETRSYAHFFSELVHLFLQSSLEGIPPDADDGPARRLKCYRMAYPFFLVAFQLDYLLYPWRGNYLVTLARRHAWLPRNSPAYRKAESITGAVLSTVR